MKHNIFAIAVVALLGCLEVAVFSGSVSAQYPRRPMAISGQSDTTELMNILNSSVDRLDSEISHITSQMEEENYNLKKVNTNTANTIKDMKQQIKDLQKAQEKITYILSVQKIEIENLKNLTSMYAENQKKMEAQIAELVKTGGAQHTVDQTQSSVAGAEAGTGMKAVVNPKVGKAEVIEEEQVNSLKDKDAGDDYFETSQDATAVPGDLLLNPRTMDENVVEEKADASKSVQPYTDDETFDMAMATYKAKNYTDSAIQFAANIKAFPKGDNFYKNLLYLGHSMKNVNNKIGACTAYAKIIHSKENIESNVRDDAEKGFEKLKCNK